MGLFGIDGENKEVNGYLKSNPLPKILYQGHKKVLSKPIADLLLLFPGIQATW
jgi:hypothetical protein